jgi:predicted esterase
MRAARVIAAALCLCLFAGSPAETPTPGLSQVTWPLPSDADFAKQYTALGKRHGFTIPPDYPRKIREKSQGTTGDGKFPDPTYELYVPKTFHRATREGEKFGLLVWVSAGPSGKPPREDWLKILDRHKLIWVGPNGVGNETDTLFRTYMAIEAVRAAKEHFPEKSIDETRIYVAGVSGGGRIASHAALVAADTFSGGFYFVGCDFFRDTPTIADPNRFYRGFWARPDPKLLTRAKTTGRYVLLTGSEDMNRDNTQSVYEGYKKVGFKYVTYIEVPNMGHTVPNMEWFEKGIELLDKTAPTTTKPVSNKLRP